MVTRSTIELATMGWADSLILMVLALVVFGPRRLPQIGRQIGKLMYEFRKASNDFKYQMEEELRSAEEADRRKKEEERLRALAPAASVQPALDSQVSEARPGAPASSTDEDVQTAPAATESPYPEEAAYRSAIAPAAEAQVEESYPRIQPPSTGKPVPAAKPWRLEEELAKVSGAGIDLGTSLDDRSATAVAEEQSPTVAGEAPAAERTAAATEQASHG
ncbi:MAG: twin-arginine translocase TatA/TatE family subunit [Terracidiphilus sp.]